MQGMRSQKLVVFNVYNTFLDYSLKEERNANSSIRSNVLTECRRVVFRPGLIRFLSKCVMKFIVAFWESKS
jgi:hypothetical protein